jgi:hypothetical protein
VEYSLQRAYNHIKRRPLDRITTQTPLNQWTQAGTGTGIVDFIRTGTGISRTGMAITVVVGGGGVGVLAWDVCGRHAAVHGVAGPADRAIDVVILVNSSSIIIISSSSIVIVTF